MLFVFVILVQVTVAALADSPAEIDPGRQDELVGLLRHDCGSCHGMTLKGGLGPALTREAMVARPKEYLYHTVRDGHPGTPMPPWRGLLSDEEIMWLVTQLQNGLPRL